MRIAFDAKRAFHNFRGLGNYSRTLLTDISEMNPSNEYLLYTPPFNDPRVIEWSERHPQLEVKLPTNSLSKSFPSWWRSVFLTNVIQKEEVDIFHGLSHELPPSIEKLPLKTVVTIHDLLFLKRPGFFKWIDRQVYKQKFQSACETADKIVAVSEQTKKDIMEFFNIPEEKIEVIYQTCRRHFGILLPEESKEEIRQKYNLPNRYILYIGAFEANKNVIGLIKSMKAIPKRDSDAPLVLVGNGKEYKEEMKRTIIELGLEKEVMIIEDAPDHDMPGLYQNASVFAYPSHYEGFGIPIIEALFSGVPVVTSKDGCFNEAGGEGALYVDPKDPKEIAVAISQLLEDENTRHEMISKGKQHIEKFKWDRVAAQMLSLYESLLNS
jgi:glycosyltransferase involved in cell wall biosynthesis